MGIKYIRDYYGVPAKRGARVEFTIPCPAGDIKRLGTIVGARNQYIRVRMDGEKKSHAYHPTWHIRYLPSNAELSGGTQEPGQ